MSVESPYYYFIKSLIRIIHLIAK